MAMTEEQWAEAAAVMAGLRVGDERLAGEISLVYRTALYGLLADEASGGRALGELHLEAGRAVVGWLRVGGYLGGGSDEPA